MLSKFEIRKIKVRHLDWWKYWGKFDADMDKLNLTTFAKFLYLKKFVGPKVSTLVDGPTSYFRGLQMS